MRLIDELKRRNVFRVSAAYVLLGWLIIQVTDTVAPALNLPDWTLAFVTWVGIIGFPFAVFFAWAYELTPDGIKREQDVDRADQLTGSTGRKLDVALVGLLIIAIGFIAWDAVFRAPEREMQATDTVRSDPGRIASESIAVLPLINMSTVSENAYFAGGVHEEILTNLSRIEGLRVVSRTTALRYVNSDLSLRDIGRELGVRFIVEGSVRRIKDHVRITVQLIDAAEDAHLWSSNYDRELVDVFATQSEVAREITNSLHLEIQPGTVGTLDDMPTRSVKAYDLYLKSKSIDRSEYQTEDSLTRQRKLLEDALEEDPDFVAAWGYLNEILDDIARSIIQNQWFGETEAQRDASFAEVREAAERALDKAIALGPDNIETLLAQASDFVAEQEYPEYRTDRKQFIDRAIELDPDSAHAWYVLAWWYRIEGDSESATPHFLRALELDPLHARLVSGSLLHFRSIGDQAMTTELFERLTQIAPEKREDRTLAQVPLGLRLDNLISLFGETADESIIETFAEELAGGSGMFDAGIIEETLYKAHLLVLRNDLDGLMQLGDVDLPKDPDQRQVILYLRIQESVLAAQRVTGRADNAAVTAHRILDFEPPLQRENDEAVFFLERIRLPANTLLGNVISRSDISRFPYADGEETFDNTPFWAVIYLAHIDVDWVVERLLERKRQHPTWFGTDITAVFHTWARRIITHPDMQAFYVEEGKWLEYLAARVPEYAQYRQ